MLFRSVGLKAFRVEISSNGSLWIARITTTEPYIMFPLAVNQGGVMALQSHDQIVIDISTLVFNDLTYVSGCFCKSKILFKEKVLSELENYLIDSNAS